MKICLRVCVICLPWSQYLPYVWPDLPTLGQTCLDLSKIYLQDGGMASAETSRERLTRLMAVRRAQLGKTWNKVAEDAGLTKEGLRGIRKGESSAIQELSKSGIEKALRWAPGSVDQILAGGDPTLVMTLGVDRSGYAVLGREEYERPAEDVPTESRSSGEVSVEEFAAMSKEEQVRHARELLAESARLMERSRKLQEQADRYLGGQSETPYDDKKVQRDAG